MRCASTHGDRIGLTVQRLNHSATLCSTVEIRIIIPFSFLISIDSNFNLPIDAHFWSEIDYCWFFLSWLFVWKLRKKSLTKNLIYSAGRICFVYEKYDRDGSELTHGERTELAVQRLNHSATLSVQPWKCEWSFLFRFCFQSIIFPFHP